MAQDYVNAYQSLAPAQRRAHLKVVD